MDSQMKKGVLEMCLLQMISQRETYGYELMSQITTLFPGATESTIYAILRRVQTDGSVEAFPGTESGGPTRRYFRLAPAGRVRLDAAVQDWAALTEAVKSLGIG